MSGYTPPAVDLTATDAAIATVDANVDAILVDTGTTLPATLATVDGVVDALAAQQALWSPPVAVAGGSVSISNSSNASYADTPMTITCPVDAGETFSVVLYLPSMAVDDAGSRLALGLEGASLGVGEVSFYGTPVTVGENWAGGIIARGGFGSGEVVTVQWYSLVDTKVVRLQGPWSALAFKEL